MAIPRSLRSGLVCGALALASLSSPAFASGAHAPGGRDAFARSRTDALYEQGKAVFRGRAKSAKGLEVCVLGSDDPADVRAARRQSLLRFRGGSPDALAAALVTCGDESRRIAPRLPRKDLQALVHYLDKRHRLRLDRAS